MEEIKDEVVSINDKKAGKLKIIKLTGKVVFLGILFYRQAKTEI